MLHLYSAFRPLIASTSTKVFTARIQARLLNSNVPAYTLITPEWLKSQLKENNNIKLLHVSWADDTQNYTSAHIEGALHFGKVVDVTAKYPNMLPKEEDFAKYVQNLGIDDISHVVLYDPSDEFVNAPRVWWMFRVFGHHLVSILDGGLAGWIASGNCFKQDEPPSKPTPSTSFQAKFDRTLFADTNDVLDAVNKNTNDVIVDARPPVMRLSPPLDFDFEEINRWLYGHINRSVSVPYSEIVDAKTHRVKNINVLIELFENAGIQDVTNQSIITYCNTGMRATPVTLAAFLTGNHKVRVYDGSWTEFVDKKPATENAIIVG